MRKFIPVFGFMALAWSASAAVNESAFAGGSSGNIPQSSGSVTNQFITSITTVTSVTVPFGANQVIVGGDDLWICENPSRCGTTFPTTTRPTTGWIYNPQARLMLGTCANPISTIYAYARSLPVSGTAIGVFEWSNNGLCQ